MMIEGCSWRQGARYLAMNKHLTGKMNTIWELLPWTKSGATVLKKNRALNSKKENLEENWCFSPVEPTRDQEREILFWLQDLPAAIWQANWSQGKHGSSQDSNARLGREDQVNTGACKDGASPIL